MTITTRSDLDGLSYVGRLVALALREMRAAVRPGITTAELDRVGARFLGRHGARSAPQLTYGFPGFNCISLNDEIVHGIPGERALKPGDVVKLDVTAELDGYIADSALTVVLPPRPPVASRLYRCAQSAFSRAMRAVRAGAPVSNIGRAVEREVSRWDFHVIRELSGHGVGRTIHESPEVPNWDTGDHSELLQPGMVLAVEPLVSARRSTVVEEADGWTLRTRDHSLAVHHEHTVVVTRGAPVIVTLAA
ncbi:MAG TPA: type I methionyl aminopeptidase [Gemmatimonadaceae bacterium]|nr:type I methionyl aminopeptidase [Gemmatimonadaceae bacterium]